MIPISPRTVSGGSTSSGGGGALTLATASGATAYYIAMQSATSGTTTSEYVTSTFTFTPSTGVLNATATSARYADLAEIYLADSDYSAGTVVVFGGSEEVTVTNNSHDTRVAGVVSTNPAYLMNASAEGLPIAMTGRVPCQVQGPVEKGTVLVTSNIEGVATAIDNNIYQPGSILGKSLETITDNSIQIIEVVVGRF